MVATSIPQLIRYEKHSEVYSYDYQEESKEPQAPNDAMIGMKVISRPNITTEM